MSKKATVDQLTLKEVTISKQAVVDPPSTIDGSQKKTKENVKNGHDRLAECDQHITKKGKVRSIDHGTNGLLTKQKKSQFFPVRFSSLYYRVLHI